MQTYIFISASLSALLLAIGAYIFFFHKTPSIWIFFSGIVLGFLAVALHLQVKVWDEEQTTSKQSISTDTTKIKQPKIENHLSASEKPIVEISNAIITKIDGSAVTVFITFSNIGKTTATNVKISSGAKLNYSRNDIDFTVPYKNENILSDIPPGAGKTMFHTSDFTPVPLNVVIQNKGMYFYIYGKIVYGNEVNKDKYRKHFSFFYDAEFKRFIDVVNGKYPPDLLK